MRFLYQPQLHQPIQCPLYRRAGQAHPGGDGVDPRPAGTILIGVFFDESLQRLFPAVQIPIVVDIIVIGQGITPRMGLAAAHPAFS